MTVYFAAGGDRIKIGWTKGDAAKRIRTISVSLGLNLTVLGSVEGTIDLERFVHEALKEYRTGGEWFADRQEVRDFLYRLHCDGPEAIGYSPKAKEPPFVYVPIERTDEEYSIMLAGLVALIWPHDGIRELTAFTGYGEAEVRTWINGQAIPPRLVRFAFAALISQFCVGKPGKSISFIDNPESCSPSRQTQTGSSHRAMTAQAEDTSVNPS